MTVKQIPAMQSRTAGFTLVELLITLVVIGILVGIALPSYRQYVIRSNRVDATSSLLRLAANQERFYLQNNTYSADLADLGFPGGGTVDGHYILAINDADAAGFEIQATPAGSQVTDVDCPIMSIDARGFRYGGKGPIGEATNDPDCWAGR